MPKQDEQLAEDMTESELAEGMEEALEGERVKTERRLDQEGAEGGDADAALDDDLDDDVPANRDARRQDDDEDDDDLDEDDEPAPSAALPEGFTRDDKGRVHRPDGTIASNEELAKLAVQQPAKDATGTEKPATADAGKPAADANAAANTPKWEPYKVKADKQDHAIPEAVGISRANGHVFIAVPEAKFDQFNRRIGLGIVAQRMSRDLDARIRDVEAYEKELREKQENPEPTEAGIEADIWLKALKGEGPYAAWLEAGQEPKLKELFEPWQLEILARDVKIALNDAKTEHATKITERRQQEEQTTAEEKSWNEGLAEAIDVIAQENPTWDTLPIDQLRQVLTELRPAMRSLLGKEEDGTLYVTTHGAQVIRRMLTALAAGTPAAAATGTDAKPDAATAGDRHERYNEGVEGARTPPSTSVKDRRDAQDRSQRGNREERRNARRRRHDGRTREQRAEDAIREETRKWLASPTLDME